MTKLTAGLIIEILGRPKEHVKEALVKLIETLGKDKGTKVINKTINEPVPVKEANDLFTSFADIEAEFETLDDYLRAVLVYMPSNIELISPEKITISNTDLTQLANVLTQRLHNYDAITKTMINERNILLTKIKEKAPDLFREIMPQQAPQSQKTEKKSEKKAPKKSKKKKAKK